MSLLRAALVAALVGPSLLSGSAVARPALDDGSLARLDRFDVLSFADPVGGGIDKHKAIGVFEATPEEVFRTATDYERLAEFAPRLVASTVVASGLNVSEVLLASDLPWPVSNAWVRAAFVTERLPGEVYRIRFYQLHGSLRRYFGAILIEPWSSGRTAVTYEVVAEPHTILPSSAVNHALSQIATRYVHALRQRVNDLHRLGRLHPRQPPSNVDSALAGTPPVVVGEVASKSR